MGDQDLPQMASPVMRRDQQVSTMMKKMLANGLAPIVMKSVWMPRIPIRNPTFQSPLAVLQKLACHPTSLEVDYQRDGTATVEIPQF